MNYYPGEMLGILELLMPLLPEIILNKEQKWDSLIINRRKPHTYRIFTTLPSGLRVCLHKFKSCDEHESFSHPHPWPGAFTILSGKYKMNIGYSNDTLSKPQSVASFIMNKYSSYEIVEPLTWHSVIPLEDTYTVMINNAPFSSDIVHKDVKTTKGKDLDSLSFVEIKEAKLTFYNFIQDWIKNA